MGTVARAAQLRGEIAGHKAAIRHHRAALGQKKAELVMLERECASRGIRLVIKEGEGETPWPNHKTQS